MEELIVLVGVLAALSIISAVVVGSLKMMLTIRRNKQLSASQMKTSQWNNRSGRTASNAAYCYSV